jgi:hypothetical protein
MSSIGPKNRILESARRIAAAIALLVVANGGLAWAQGAPPLPFNTPVPKTIGVVLRPIAGDPDARILRAYAERNHEKIRARFGSAAADYDIETAFVGRSKIAPGPEPQILFLLTGPRDCLQNQCTGFAITKADDTWVELTAVSGFVHGAFGVVYLATEPIPARLFNPETYEYDIAAIVEPENEGRRTLVWNEGGLYWNGYKWAWHCWQRCE